MSAGRYFYRLLSVTFLTFLLFGLAALSPLVAGSLTIGSRETKQDGLVSCFFVPTRADWPSHIVSYTFGVAFLISLLAGPTSLLRQWWQTRRTVNALLKHACRAQDPFWPRLNLPPGVRDCTDLIRLDRAVAFCHGWVQPRICISTGAISGFSAREIEALLLHEYHHVLRRDPLKTALSRMLARSFFFLPVVRVLREQYMVAKEIEADDYASSTQGSYSPLLGALYKLLSQSNVGAAPSSHVGLVIARAVDAINPRLDYLLDKKLPAGPRVASILVSAFVIAAATAGMGLATRAAVANALWYQAHALAAAC